MTFFFIHVLFLLLLLPLHLSLLELTKATGENDGGVSKSS